jgi:hypothetical protein
VGDFDADDLLTVADIDLLTTRIRTNRSALPWLPPSAFDVNGDSDVNSLDRHVWVHGLRHTWFGDANLDLVFNFSDMVQVFGAGKYETDEEAGWSEGDWNGDGFCDSSDMVTAFVDGGYEQGRRTDAAAVPEPLGWTLFVMAAGALLTGWRRL